MRWILHFYERTKYMTKNKIHYKKIIILIWAFRLASSPSGFPLIVLGRLAGSPASGLSATIPNAQRFLTEYSGTK